MVSRLLLTLAIIISCTCSSNGFVVSTSCRRRCTRVGEALAAAAAETPVLTSNNKETTMHRRLSVAFHTARASEAGEVGLAVVNGLTIALLISHSKTLLSRMEVMRARMPVIAPLIGGALVTLIYSQQPDLATGPASIGGTDSQFSMRRQILRFLAVCLAIGSGNALALAGPAAEIGMAIARVLSGRPGDNLSRPLILSGAAAGLAANFDTPIAGILYALEVSRKTINSSLNSDQTQKSNSSSSTREVGIITLAAVVASLVVRARAGSAALPIRGPLSNSLYSHVAITEYPLLAIIAAAAAFLTNYFINGGLKSFLAKIFNACPPRARPMLGSATASLAQLAGLPQALPHLYHVYGKVASGSMSRWLLAQFLLVKVLCVSAASASGLVGGAVAPYLLVGTALGGVVSGTSTASFAALGSVAVLAAFFQAPLTFSVLIVEMTQALHLSVPLLFTATLSALISNLMATQTRIKNKS